ncbi:MAG: hypothetical protein WC719_02715 [Patescibacteria group bacterium]|jgi:hypothetical protein
MRKNERLVVQEDAASKISGQAMKKWGEDISAAKSPDEKKKLRVAFKEAFGVNFSQRLAEEIFAKENEPKKEKIEVAQPEEKDKKKAAFKAVLQAEAEDAKLLAEVRDNLSPIVEETKVEEPQIKNTPAAEVKPEASKDIVLEKFKDFNITEEEIKTVPGFSELTQAQQALVYDGLKQMSLVEVKSRAQEDFKESMKEKGFFGRIFKGLTKKYNIAQEEKKEAAYVKRGGLALHQSNLEELTGMISALKIDATIENGQVKVNYLKTKEALSAEQNETLKEFNDVADRFSKLPQEWSLKTASQKERGEYQYLSALYEAHKADALEVLKVGGSDKSALLEMHKTDYQIKMMQFLAAHPEIDKEFSKIEHQSALKKMISGEAAARGSYMAGGFAVRHTLVGLIGLGGLPVAAASFVAAPLAAAGIGAWRGRDRAKTSLVEKDIAGRKTNEPVKITNVGRIRKEIVNSLKDLVPAEYALNPQDWYQAAASEEEKKRYDKLQREYQIVMNVYEDQVAKESDKTEKHFYKADDLTEKLQSLITKAKTLEGNEFRSALLSLKVRAQFSEDKLAAGLVNFGAGGALSEKLDLVQALSEARSLVTLNSAALEKKKEDQEALGDPQKDLEKRFASLFNSKYFEFDKNLDEARKKYIKKEMIKGAGIGATFAIGGALLRDLAGELGIMETHPGAVKLNTENPENVANTVKPIHFVTEEQPDTLASRAQDSLGSAHNNLAAIQKAVEDEINSQQTFSNVISNEGLGGQSDSVWHSTKEIFMDNAEKLGYQGDIHDSGALSKWAEIQTNGAIHNSGEITDKVFEGNVVSLEKDEAGNFFVKVEAGEGGEPGVLGQMKAEEIKEPVLEKEAIPQKISMRPSAEIKLSLNAEKIMATGDSSHVNLGSENIADTAHLSSSDIETAQASGDDLVSSVDATSTNTVASNNLADANIASHTSTQVGGGENVISHGGTPEVISNESHTPLSIFEAIDTPEADTSSTLDTVMKFDKIEAIDKVLLEFAKEKGASSSMTVKELLDTYPGITAYMDENAGDSIYAHLYDLRHAASGEQSKMLVEDLQANLKDEFGKSENYQKQFDLLVKHNVFQIGESLNGEPTFAFKFGAAEKSFEFSAEGFKNLKNFLAESVIGYVVKDESGLFIPNQ